MTPPGIEPANFQFVAQHLKHCAIAVPLYRTFTLTKKTANSLAKLKAHHKTCTKGPMDSVYYNIP